MRGRDVRATKVRAIEHRLLGHVGSGQMAVLEDDPGEIATCQVCLGEIHANQATALEVFETQGGHAKVHPVVPRAVQIDRRKVYRPEPAPCNLSPEQVGSIEVAGREVAAVQTGQVELGASEIGLGAFAVGHLCVLDVCLLEISPTQVAVDELEARAHQIGELGAS